VKPTVSIARCPDYSPENVRRGVDEAIAKAGGLERRVRRGDRVFVKINHLGHHTADSAIVTHPEVAAAVACHLKDLGARVTVGDGLESTGTAFYEKSGYLETARRCGIELVNLKGRGYKKIEAPSGAKLALALDAVECDHLVNVAKMKTHGLTVVTLAIKNLYGLLPHLYRHTLHRDYVIPSRFAAAVVDVYAEAVPAFNLVDAVTALEGNGPSRGGRPRHVGLLVAGADGVAVDAVCSAIMGVDPLNVAVTRIAAERGLGTADLGRIEIAGLPLAEARVDSFAVPETIMNLIHFIDRLPGPAAQALTSLVGATRETPRVVLGRCVGCGLCARHCPQGAIRMVDGKPRINYGRCISCFCCQEFCQSDAIELSRSRVADFLFDTLKAVKKVFRVFRKKKKADA